MCGIWWGGGGYGGVRGWLKHSCLSGPRAQQSPALTTELHYSRAPCSVPRAPPVPSHAPPSPHPLSPASLSWAIRMQQGSAEWSSAGSPTSCHHLTRCHHRFHPSRAAIPNQYIWASPGHSVNSTQSPLQGREGERPREGGVGEGRGGWVWEEGEELYQSCKLFLCSTSSFPSGNELIWLRHSLFVISSRRREVLWGPVVSSKRLPVCSK